MYGTVGATFTIEYDGVPETAIVDGLIVALVTLGGAPGPSIVTRSRKFPSYWSGGNVPCNPSDIAMYSRPNDVIDLQKLPGVVTISSVYVPGEFVRSSTHRTPLESK